MTTDLFESLAILMVLVAISAVLPTNWFRDVFVARGTLMTLLGLAYMIYLAVQFQGREDYPGDVIRLIPVVALAIFVIAFFAGKVAFLKKILQGFAEHATVFIYLSVPLSMLSLFIVIIGNLS